VAQPIDALICPRWTIPVRPDLKAHNNLTIALNKGKIVSLLPKDEALTKFEPSVLHERPNHVVLPGLINTHTHAAMTLLRGLGDDLPLQTWLEEKIWPAEMRFMSPKFVRDGTYLAIAEMLQGGITCFADMYFYPDSSAEVALETGIRMVAGMIAIDFPTPWASSGSDCISKGLLLHDAYRKNPLISTMFAPHAPYTVSDATLSRIRQLADELEVPVQIHVHETATEIENAVKDSGIRPLERLNRLGLVNSGFMAVHATQLNHEDIELLANSGCSVVHCPRSNLKLVSGACPAAELIEAGVNVALGTDGAASNNQLNLWAEMSTAALFGKFIAGDPATLPAKTVLECATLNGARALGLDHEIGSLEPGKSADLISVDLSKAGTQPVLDPLSQLVYATNRDNVTDTWVAGEHLLKDHEFTRIDTEPLLLEANKWAKKVMS
jgi:5-methylthioadenosine/S-adenosylhomocysteine deaminase